MTRKLPRALAGPIQQALAAFPVVVVTGARQTGKSTLIRFLLGPPHREYRTLDDLDLLERVKSDPDSVVSTGRPLTLDEIQRSPELLLAIKRVVDERGWPGQFLLSGSANLSLMRNVSESLAGRAAYFTLHPLTHGERAGKASSGAWQTLLEDPSRMEGEHPPADAIAAAVLAGGFPRPALARNASEGLQWFDGYVRTYIERDLHALASIHNLVDFRRLMRAAALRSGCVLNQSEMARDVGLPQATAHRYLDLLETSFLVYRLPAFAVNRTKRLIKAPKLYFCDSGLAAFLAGARSETELARSNLIGPLLENLVLSDLLSWREQQVPRPEAMYWRTTLGEEVDLVVETSDRVLPVEVKSASRVRQDDLRSMRVFLEQYGSLAPHGVVLHCGRVAEQIGKRIWAIPLSALLGQAALD
ncbi:MAG: ATP-binding protein [Candidatus Wallbacteria bacterium]|nr:ATP-binding protein [Candidatus Wallbacteria bacterium]